MPIPTTLRRSLAVAAASVAGVVRLAVRVGDQVARGGVVATIEMEDA